MGLGPLEKVSRAQLEVGCEAGRGVVSTPEQVGESRGREPQPAVGEGGSLGGV